MAPVAKSSALQSAFKHADVHYTVLIRLPFPRGDFVDPPSVRSHKLYIFNAHVDYQMVGWNPGKDQELWDLLFRASAKGHDLDCMLFQQLAVQSCMLELNPFLRASIVGFANCPQAYILCLNNQ